MSFRQLFIELNELSEWMSARCRRRIRKSRLGERELLQRQCLEFNLEPVLSQAVRRARFVIVDTETTGFEAYAGDELVEVAFLEYRGLRPTGRYLHTRIHPGIPIPQTSSAIHGIHDEDVAQAPCIDDVFDDIVRFIGGSALIGHHVAFDMRFLNRAAQRLLDCRLPNPIIDTMVLYLAWTGKLDQYGLDTVAENCGVKIEGRHTARGDAAACGRIFAHIARDLLPPDATIADLMAISTPSPDYGPDHLGPERVGSNGDNGTSQGSH